MKKLIYLFIVTIIINLALIQAECDAKNYYAFCIYELTGKSGKKIAMNIITKTYNHNTCKATANSNPKKWGKWILFGSESTTGDQHDKNFSAVFSNQPVMGVYLSYVNLDGFDTRVTFVGVAGKNSPVPGLPIDIPVKMIMPTINSMKQQLESAGIKNIKVIYPRNK
ncbi:MAG: hypothetical protein P9M13_01240 [Candidatus Ancaeobacter aquaticus]|nr:hypothetical protein [Candidatus Ancaeobacter aquaticus]